MTSGPSPPCSATANKSKAVGDDSPNWFPLGWTTRALPCGRPSASGLWRRLAGGERTRSTGFPSVVPPGILGFSSQHTGRLGVVGVEVNYVWGHHVAEGAVNHSAPKHLPGLLSKCPSVFRSTSGCHGCVFLWGGGGGPLAVSERRSSAHVLAGPAWLVFFLVIRKRGRLESSPVLDVHMGTFFLGTVQERFATAAFRSFFYYLFPSLKHNQGCLQGQKSQDGGCNTLIKVPPVFNMNCVAAILVFLTIPWNTCVAVGFPSKR